MAGHEHALAAGERVADQVDDSVRLSSARRTLHQHALVRVESLDDLALRIVRGQREVNFAWWGAGVATARHVAWSVVVRSAYKAGHA